MASLVVVVDVLGHTHLEREREKAEIWVSGGERETDLLPGAVSSHRIAQDPRPRSLTHKHTHTHMYGLYTHTHTLKSSFWSKRRKKRGTKERERERASR